MIYLYIIKKVWEWEPLREIAIDFICEDLPEYVVLYGLIHSSLWFIEHGSTISEIVNIMMEYSNEKVVISKEDAHVNNWYSTKYLFWLFLIFSTLFHPNAPIK